MCSDRGQGPGELEALTRMGVPHRIGWGHSWLSLAGPELGAEIEIKLLFIKCWPFGDTCYRSYGLPSCIITRDNNPTSYEVLTLGSVLGWSLGTGFLDWSLCTGAGLLGWLM